jgi:hypothetical protein
MSTEEKPILDRLNDALKVAVYTHPEGLRPTALYLGYVEQDAYWSAVGKELSVQDQVRKRAEYRGVPIYIVDAEHHLYYGHP